MSWHDRCWRVDESNHRQTCVGGTQRKPGESRAPTGREPAPVQHRPSATDPMALNQPLLSLRDVTVAFRTAHGELPVTGKVAFDIARGERVGLVGESGCGKTVTGLAVMRLLPPQVARITGRIDFGGRDLAQLPERTMRAVRGRDIAMIFQEPMSALDPVFTVGTQISEAWLAHHPGHPAQARLRAIEALAQVGIAQPARRYGEYPPHLSGGVGPRALIAMAIICARRLLIADEPTPALAVA